MYSGTSGAGNGLVVALSCLGLDSAAGWVVKEKCRSNNQVGWRGERNDRCRKREARSELWTLV
jgi:hypothetical protein